ncbi:hypothetical protein F5Y16DRAFT_360964 [Xylariaceae sp. FL0255]|nr:hypothetical protein F5Y16DRAFT_360964 [Xylariaceae sp. FL0255]
MPIPLKSEITSRLFSVATMVTTTRKRIIVCCDGTWQNSDNGYIKAGNHHPKPSLQIPSNVTRISRCFRRTCSDGTFQIIYYQSGVGSRAGLIFDRLLGGAFGFGISENIREAYAFICANYVDGDEIILLGFSRGAFTARSIGGMISDLGLLTREGMDHFYPIFKDMQNWRDPKYKDPFPTQPFPDKPKGEGAATIYSERLVKAGLARIKWRSDQQTMIRVKAIGVWDTVGSLGIPNAKILSKIGIKPCTHEYEFYNTRLTNKIEHGFHALALDETRSPFSPSLWERSAQNQDTSDLRQVWFPGSHANIGGGWPDQGVANTTLAWMMDQLSSIGVEFRPETIHHAFAHNITYYEEHEKLTTEIREAAERCGQCIRGKRHLGKKIWAEMSIFEANQPIRPWSLHMISTERSFLTTLMGRITRAPGLYHKADPKTGRPTVEFLEGTNERIHPSVRVRLSCQGLGLNDKDLWSCAALLKYWRPRRVADEFFDPVSRTADWGSSSPQNQPKTTGVVPEQSSQPSDNTIAVNQIPEFLQMLSINPSKRWVWEYIGPEDNAPPTLVMVEENLGPYEQILLKLAAGKVHVYQYAEGQDPQDFKVLHYWKFTRMMRKLHYGDHHSSKARKRKRAAAKKGKQPRPSDNTAAQPVESPVLPPRPEEQTITATT